MKRWGLLALFLLLTLGGGWIMGSLTDTSGWYQEIAKPSFTPPNWVFPVAWTTLYVLIAIAGWRVHLAGLARARALWWLQLVLNFAWTPLFFALHWTGVSLLVVAAMLVIILSFIAESWRGERLAAGCFVPYACWVAYAGVLNASIWWMN
ncbi:TspO/MBR family protein [Consotaella salsifontis]|uniref:TspO and MBR related proteins n=1 Tax=Consotaella salsifontis TaxID=1365950 RepID=A0A1T4STE9_9HYPH|nr:TspO/MBR family protein [Consotaella salsifontis]SKA31479.1 TspO and MBR related proteins [Consotaella salsifontis]